MITRKHIRRRSLLKVIGASGAVAFGAGTVSARNPERGEPTFFARLSDNPSIPGHEKVNSRGKGRVDLVGGEAEPLEFELRVRSLVEGATAIRVRGGGSAEGPVLVTLYRGDAINGVTLNGSIEDDDVALDRGVRELIWERLVDGDGVVTVETGFAPNGEIAGVVRPRPVGGWIAV